MKRLTLIFILLSYSFTYTEANELIKIPKLFEHYSEHRAADKTISFTEFLGMHYIQTHHHDSDDEKDSNLPFKSHNHCAIVSTSFFHDLETQSITIKPTEIQIANNLPSLEEYTYSSFQVSIWQPPKFI